MTNRRAETGCPCATDEAGGRGGQLVERIKDRIAEQMVDIPVLRVMEEIVAAVQEVIRLVRQECVQQRIDEQLVEVPVPQVL